MLKTYENCFGELINLSKPGLWFISNSSHETMVRTMDIMGIRKLISNDPYLSLPLMFDRSQSKGLHYIVDKIQARVSYWNNRHLSYAEKETIIKSVAQSIPVYSMSCSWFPQGLIYEINRLLAHFWWGDNKKHRKIHWKKWGDLCVSKLDGCFGFRDANMFNIGLLAK